MPHHIKLYAAFFLYALTLGAIFPRLGELQLAMGVGEGALGLGLLGFSLGTQVSLMLAGGLVERLGHRWVILLGVPMLGIGELLATQSLGILGFFTSLIFAGLAVGPLEIVINLEVDRTEHQLGRRIMSRSHAFWSFGFFAAGIIGAGAAQSSISPTVHLLLLTSATTFATILGMTGFKPAPARIASEGPAPKFVRPSSGILLIVVFTLSAMLLEGAGADWSVIFMRDSFETTPFVNGLAFAIGALTQAITRFFADGIIDRYGPLRVARTMISLLGLGAVMVTFSPNASVALAGFAIMGIGTSSIFPLAMSAAAQRTDRPAVTNVASLAQLSFIVFLIAPPLLGYIAEHFGIRVSFGVALPLIVVSWFTARHLAPTRD